MGRPKENPKFKNGSKLTCYVPKAYHDAMKVICERTGMSVSYFIRRAIFEKIERMNKGGETNG